MKHCQFELHGYNREYQKHKIKNTMLTIGDIQTTELNNHVCTRIFYLAKSLLKKGKRISFQDKQNQRQALLADSLKTY